MRTAHTHEKLTLVPSFAETESTPVVLSFLALLENSQTCVQLDNYGGRAFSQKK